MNLPRNLLVNLFDNCFLIVDRVEAIAYCERRRNIAPAVYNKSKLRERRRRRNRGRRNANLDVIATLETVPVTPGPENQSRDNFSGSFQFFSVWI